MNPHATSPLADAARHVRKRYKAAIADRALLMVDSARHLVGDLATVLTEDNLAELYGIALRAVRLREGSSELTAVVPVFQSQIARR